jgi:GNAT superfamily N-acetyltransferase
MVRIVKTGASNKDFLELVKALDAYLAITDGDDHAFYDQYNKLDKIKHILVAYKEGIAIGCGAIKVFNREAVEIKRMYLKPAYRGAGIAEKIIQELENWTKELGYKKCILETGERQVEAVKFYHKVGYKRAENYGQYIGVENSLCFEKQL